MEASNLGNSSRYIISLLHAVDWLSR